MFKFIFRQLKHSTFIVYSNNIIFNMVKAAQHFSKISIRNLREKFDDITWPSGQLQISKYNYLDQWKYYFNLHPVFVLNFTLQSMYISNDCKFINCKSYLKIEDHIGGNDSSKFSQHRFIGYIPSFSFYSASKEVDLHIYILPYIFILENTFSVLDHHVIKNTHINYKNQYFLGHILTFRIKYSKEVLTIYFIKVKRLSQIMIEFRKVEGHYLVYDCPNFVPQYKKKFYKEDDIIYISMYCTSINKI